MTMEMAVEVSRLFIPIVAVAGVFIAWQQFQANKAKIRVELYQRRLDVYRVLLEAIQVTSYLDEERDEHEVFSKLELALDEAYFLLPESIYQKIQPIEERAYNIHHMHWSAGNMQESLAKPLSERIGYKQGQLEAQYKQLSDEFKKEVEWFREHAQPLLRESFKEVLGFYRF
ncbi:hypothetical protein [Sedimenticola selenatireducens]|uniref:hypothetical protein n=1 Tax=Sedimenticola selenatireducens TaxID=191960 RepID=UPI002AAB447D|nr:hypothetical protein [Sedimenticola selenatireducens]